MPELPEVKVVAKSLEQTIKNQKIIDIKIINEKFIKEINAQDFINAIINQTIINVSNYGKFILIFLSNKKVILSHLRMEGKYTIIQNKIFPKHTYLIFKFESGWYLCYSDSRMFGTFHLRELENYNKIPPLSKLAKTPEQSDVNEIFLKFQKKNIAIKSALLDQSLVVGLGNIYVNEALWAAQINPTRSAKSISKKELSLILEHSTRIMDASFALGGSSILSYESLNSQKGSYQNFLQVHTKQNKPCSRCNNLISKIKVNGRGTYYCAFCQK